ncbi:MAG: 3-oxoacyl-ACP reductase family protein [Candidatus Dormiibacterota bacterium]
MGRLEGKTAIVTGGAKGIGRAIVEAYVAEGARVASVDVQYPAASGGTPLAGDDQNSAALYLQVDVADPAQAANMADLVQKEFGRIDVLVNNAGVHGQVSVEDMAVDEWDRVMAVNLRGVFLCTRFVLTYMLRQGSGRIINIASNLGQIGGMEMAHYSAAKGGVIAFTKSLAREVCQRGVLVNAIAPGPIRTDVIELETPEWRARKLAEVPLRRLGETSEVTPVAVFLASGDSTFFVGQTLSPNGGDTML